MGIHINIGINNWEKAIKRLVIFDIKIDSSYIVDVDIVQREIAQYCANKSFDYTENLVDALKNHLQKIFKATECIINATKAPLLNTFHYSCEN